MSESDSLTWRNRVRTLAKAAELMMIHQAGKMRGRRGRQAATGSLTKSWEEGSKIKKS